MARRPAAGSRRCSSAICKEEGRYPEMVGLSIWGTAHMRTHGDDVAEVLALLGVEPVWNAQSRRVQGVDAHPARRARPSAHRRHAAHQRILPRRVSASDRAGRSTRSRWSSARTSRPTGTSRASTTSPISSGMPPTGPRRGGGPGALPRLRLQARNLRRRHPAADRDTQLANRSRTSPRSFSNGAATPTAATPTASMRATLFADRLRSVAGRGAQSGQPRARHLRFRRLLPVPRRHDRDHPRADRPRSRRPTSATARDPDRAASAI